MSAAIVHEAATGSTQTNKYTVTATIRGDFDKPDWALCLTGEQQHWAHMLQGHYERQNADKKYFIQRMVARSTFTTVWDLMVQADKRRLNKELLKLLRKLVDGTATVSDLIIVANQVKWQPEQLTCPYPRTRTGSGSARRVAMAPTYAAAVIYALFGWEDCEEGPTVAFNSAELAAWMLEECRTSVIEARERKGPVEYGDWVLEPLFTREVEGDYEVWAVNPLAATRSVTIKSTGTGASIAGGGIANGPQFISGDGSTIFDIEWAQMKEEDAEKDCGGKSKSAKGQRVTRRKDSASSLDDALDAALNIASGTGAAGDIDEQEIELPELQADSHQCSATRREVVKGVWVSDQLSAWSEGGAKLLKLDRKGRMAPEQATAIAAHALARCRNNATIRYPVANGGVKTAQLAATTKFVLAVETLSTKIAVTQASTTLQEVVAQFSRGQLPHDAAFMVPSPIIASQVEGKWSVVSSSSTPVLVPCGTAGSESSRHAQAAPAMATRSKTAAKRSRSAALAQDSDEHELVHEQTPAPKKAKGHRKAAA